jgi:hypothetical protein
MMSKRPQVILRVVKLQRKKCEELLIEITEIQQIKLQGSMVAWQGGQMM